MEKKTIIAIVVSVLILIAYQEIFLKRVLKMEQPQKGGLGIFQSQKVSEKPESSDKDINSEKNVKVEVPAPESKENSKNEYIKNPEDKFFNVENNLFYLTFSNKGGSIAKCFLKNYYEDVSKKRNVSLFSRLKDYPFSNTLLINDQIVDKDIVYQSDISQDSLINVDKAIDIVFTYSKDNFLLKKIYTVDPDKYEIKLRYEYKNLADTPLKIENTTYFYREKVDKEAKYQFEGSCFLVDGVLKEVSVKDIEKNKIEKYNKNVQWLAYSEVYFVSVLLKKDMFFDEAKTYLKGNDVILEGNKIINLKVNEELTDTNFIYLGPKKYDILKSYNAGIERSIDYGMFDFLAKPLMVTLNYFYKYVHNYGVAIILLTILIKIIFYPLTQKSYQSMKKMKDLQPHLEKIKQKYKDDKAKLNQEIMELYKRQKVNPFGGCLPILIQIPVFFALYKALLNSIELRHAPFLTYLPIIDKPWLVDLSVKDPYYITPILMGATMFIQQKMTPTGGGDALQEKIMYFMPIFMTFLFLNFPSGLVVYWLANNVLSIIQQYMVNKKLDKK